MCQDTSTMIKFTVIFTVSMYAHGRQQQLAGDDSPTVWVLSETRAASLCPLSCLTSLAFFSRLEAWEEPELTGGAS